MTKRFNEVRANVAKLMHETPNLTNDDLALIIAYWEKYDDAKVCITKGTKPLTSPATILRRRQEIQQTGDLLPTKLSVRRKRGKTSGLKLESQLLL